MMNLESMFQWICRDMVTPGRKYAPQEMQIIGCFAVEYVAKGVAGLSPDPKGEKIIEQIFEEHHK